MRTQHEMQCVGRGLPIDSALDYSVRISFPELIGHYTIPVTAYSEEQARLIAEMAHRGATIHSVELRTF